LFSDKAQKLRNAIFDDGRLARIVNFEQYQVFADAGITTGIFIFRRGGRGVRATVLREKNYPPADAARRMNAEENYFDVRIARDSVFPLIDESIARLNAKIDGAHPLLQDVALVGKGMETAADDVFLFTAYPRQFPKKFIKKRITGKNIDRYYVRNEGDYALYFEDVENFRDLPVSIQNHLKAYRKELRERATVKNEGRAWWRYSRPMHREYYHLPKLYCSRRAHRNTFCFDDGFDCLGFSNMTVIFDTNKNFPLKYLLALLNSKLLTFRYRSIGKQTGGGSFEYFPNGVGKLPIRALNLSDPADKAAHDKLASLADAMLALKQREAAEPNPRARESITRQIISTDAAIDAAVYALYGLTDEEVAIVEGR